MPKQFYETRLPDGRKVMVESKPSRPPEQTRLLETVADIAYQAGGCKYYSGDSRKDIADFIGWAVEFESLRKTDAEGNEFYNDDNYMSAIEAFTAMKLSAKT